MGDDELAELRRRRMAQLQQQAGDQQGMQEIALGRASKGNITASEAIRLEANSKLGVMLESIELDTFIVESLLIVGELLQANLSVDDAIKMLGEDEAVAFMKVSQSLLDLEFDVTLEVVTTLPFDTEREKLDAMEVYKILGPPFLPRLLEAMQVADRDRIIQGNEAWQMIQSVMQMAEKTGQSPQQMLEMFQKVMLQLAEQQPTEQTAPPPTGAAA